MSAHPSVLVIDDELGMREMLAFELSSEGFEVETAANGKEAVEALRRRKFDLAVTDLKMPEMDGVATLEALRSIDPEIEIIVATGYATVESAVECMKRGAYDYIQKPFNLEELRLLLDRAMHKSRLQGAVALYEASRALLATVEPDDLVALVIDIAGRALASDAVGLVLQRTPDGPFELHRPAGAATPSDDLLRELAESAMRAGRALRYPSGETPSLPTRAVGEQFSSALVHPVAGREVPFGALVLLRGPRSPAFSLSELHKGTVFANQLALALENSRLHHQLARQIEQLVATREQLVQSEKLALAGQLAGSVAHEVNNPLAAVSANLRAVQDYSTTIGKLWLAAKAAAAYLRGQQAGPASEIADSIYGAGGTEQRTERLVREIADVVDESLEAVRRIADLVAGFRSLAGTGVEPIRQRVDVAEVARECVAALPRCLGCTEAEPAVIAVGTFPPAFVSREDLRTALLNVLAYCCGRGPATGERKPEHRVVLSVGTDSARPCVLVSDPTAELSAEEQARIFDPRIEPDSQRQGTLRMNFRLALAHGVLRRNGAELTASAGGERGVTFRILLAPAQGVDRSCRPAS